MWVLASLGPIRAIFFIHAVEPIHQDTAEKKTLLIFLVPIEDPG